MFFFEKAVYLSHHLPVKLLPNLLRAPDFREEVYFSTDLLRLLIPTFNSSYFLQYSLANHDNDIEGQASHVAVTKTVNAQSS